MASNEVVEILLDAEKHEIRVEGLVVALRHLLDADEQPDLLAMPGIVTVVQAIDDERVLWKSKVNEALEAARRLS